MSEGLFGITFPIRGKPNASLLYKIHLCFNEQEYFAFLSNKNHFALSVFYKLTSFSSEL